MMMVYVFKKKKVIKILVYENTLITLLKKSIGKLTKIKSLIIMLAIKCWKYISGICYKTKFLISRSKGIKKV